MAKPSRKIFRILSNSGFVFLGDLIQKALGLVTVLLLSNYLNVSGFGLYSYILAYIAFFSVFIDFGLNHILVREISQDPGSTPKYMGACILIRLGLAGTLYAVMILLFYLLGESGQNLRLLAVAALSVFFQFSTTYHGFYQSTLRMVFPVLIRAAVRIISVALLLLLMVLEADLMSILALEALSGLLGLLGLVYISRKQVKPDFSFDPRFYWTLMGQAVPITILSFCVMIYFRIDVVMLAQMKGHTAVGLYSAANRLVEALPMIPSALMISLFPLLSVDYEKNRLSFENLFHKSMKFLAILIAPVVAFVYLFSEQIIGVLYRDNFRGAAPVLGILVIAQVFVYFNILFTNVFISSRKQKLISWVTVAMAGANVGLNLFLIPAYSAVGAAVATVITEILGTALALYLLKKSVDLFLSPILWRVLGVAVVYTYALSILDSMPLPLAFIAAIAIYVPLLFITRLVSVEEVLELKKNFAG